MPAIHNNKIVLFSHVVISIAFGLFFMYAGIKKFIPKPKPKTIDNSEFIQAFTDNVFESPITFKLGIKALKASGFLKMVGVLQILSSLLILFPRTRLIGLLMLLPITVNIFCFHFFMDNRPGENIETCLLLAVNIILIAFYYFKLKALINHKIDLTWQ